MDPSKPHDSSGHRAHHSKMPDCPDCLAQPDRRASARIAWTVAAVAVLLLVGVFIYGASSTPGLAFGAGGLVLLAILACPLIMGAMMFFMMRGKNM